ncbi:Leucyl/phenylalanyl-tRNA--protein transferase [hydrothermal vent metagenome]|uniref:Leucyl/phenylalanyl-tRNA--protein transferase n=1 Tax=hydrothermal vent metagenome TaxID=652676 RepID=A0A1W1CYU4_9ZZZZ
MFLGDEDDYYVMPLNEASLAFPNPRLADDEGLLAYGGDLSSQRLLHAYKKGIFPWYAEGDPILWWSPNPRLILYSHNFKVRKSFKRVLRSGKFEVTFDRNFREVISHCASVRRNGQASSWIVEEIKDAYIKLHDEGYGHSVEVYLEGKLVGGLYGIAFGKAFFGESMFSLCSDASKVAFKALSDVLGERGYDFIDCQMKTDHMVGLGAIVVEREVFLDALEVAITKPTDFGKWHDFSWEYKE